MSQKKLTDIALAWAEASDGDVVDALRHPEDYTLEAVDIIGSEAARRDLGACAEMPQEGRLGALGFASFQRTWHRLTHRYMVASLVGMSFPLGRIVRSWSSLDIPMWLEAVILGLVYCGGVAIASWPLADYRRAVRVAFAAALGFTIIGTLNAAFRDPGYARIPTWFFAFATISVLALTWAIGFAVLGGAVFLRKRFWPIYPLGHCAQCGYNLFGLERSRCPECGRPFLGEGLERAPYEYNVCKWDRLT